MAFSLEYKGFIKLPSYGREPQWNTPIYNQGYQAIAYNPNQPDRLYVTWGNRNIGSVELIAPSLTPTVFPKWIQNPTLRVGQAFRNLVEAKVPGYGDNWARLRGIAIKEDRVWCNYGQYYHVIADTYPNFNSVSTTLDTTTETPLGDVELINGVKPHVKQHAGLLATVPDGWLGDYDFIRGDYWLNMSDYGPMLQLIDKDVVDHKAMKYTWASAFSNTNKHPDWCLVDEWTGAFFFSKPETCQCCHQSLPGGGKFMGIVGLKGTPPGWYGSPQGPNGVYDACRNSQGTHGYPYKGVLWIYNVKDVVDVINKVKKTYEILPVQKFDLPNFKGSQNCQNIGGCIFANDMLYVVQIGAMNPSTNASDAYTWMNIIHCYKIN